MAKESIKDMSLQELKDKLRSSLEEMRNINIQLVTNQIGNKKRKWVVRKRIAQIRTIINEYALGIRKTKQAEKK